MNQKKVLILEEQLYEYLNHVIERHAARGIDPEEGLALFHLWRAVKNAQTVTNPAPVPEESSPEAP